jgi:hypothetical protein
MTRLSAVLGGFVVVATLFQPQGSSPDGMWQPITTPDRLRAFSAELGPVQPPRLAAFTLASEQLEQTLARARREFSPDSPIVSIPMPDGRYLAFRVQETEVMTKELSDSLRFKTYRGENVENRRITARFEYGPEGFRALVFTLTGRVFVEPVARPEPAYVSYAARRPQLPVAPQANNNPPRCLVTAADAAEMMARLRGAAARPEGPPPPADPPGSLLRTYRLAMAATGEYVKFHGGTVDQAARAIGATVQRVNEVYENDLGITFRLVAKERDVIFTDTTTYTNNNADRLLIENRRVLDEKIGTANYDIGHVLSTGAGGKAAAGVCDPSHKARGATGRSKPVGDPFDIDYVAHEIGHQLGANHTFNSTLGNCGGGNRYPGTAFEPGSGSTVLAYAGICPGADLQTNSHPYFHAATLDEIRDYVVMGTGSRCGTRTATGNTPPVASVPASSITIPRGTPFRLTGSATDNEQSTLFYTWEELDLGASAPPEGDADGNARPLFRSYVPDSSGTRVFPALDILQSGKPRIGETLPATGRPMAFRLTVRDASNPAGGFGSADVSVIVAKSGPLKVTKPPAGITVVAGTAIPVAWMVNGTDQGEVACAKVALRLSLDDAATIAYELQASTANDGTETVTIPPGASGVQARILVECASMPFFAVSPPFAIKPPS